MKGALTIYVYPFKDGEYTYRVEGIATKEGAKAILAKYKGDFSDHSQGLDVNGLIERVRGVSADYNKPSDRRGKIGEVAECLLICKNGR